MTGWDSAADTLWMALATFTVFDLALRSWALVWRASQAMRTAPAWGRTVVRGARFASEADSWRWVVSHARWARLAIACARSTVTSVTNWQAGTVALLIVASVVARGATGEWAHSVAPSLELSAFFVTGGISVLAVARGRLKRVQVSATNLGRRETNEQRSSDGHP